MAEKETEIDVSDWSSTYGLLTSQRVLERFNINLTNDEVEKILKSPRSVYYQLLRIPLKNVFNGIIFQQAHDYQVYAQKLFIDYLLSGDSSKEAGSPGATTRDELENERTRLIEIGEGFNTQETAQQNLICDSQASLIKLAYELNDSLQTAANEVNRVLQLQQIIKDDKLVLKAVRSAIIHYEKIDNENSAASAPLWGKIAESLQTELNDEIRLQLAKVFMTLSQPIESIENILSTYIEQTKDMGISLRSYRSQFYDLILRATELIRLLPDYRVNVEKEAENRSSLYFDAQIGGI